MVTAGVDAPCTNGWRAHLLFGLAILGFRLRLRRLRLLILLVLLWIGQGKSDGTPSPLAPGLLVSTDGHQVHARPPCTLCQSHTVESRGSLMTRPVAHRLVEIGVEAILRLALCLVPAPIMHGMARAQQLVSRLRMHAASIATAAAGRQHMWWETSCSCTSNPPLVILLILKKFLVLRE